MDNNSHKNTWNNFTKFVLWGTVAVITVLVLMCNISSIVFLFFMNLASISENHNIEKRIAITPEIAKKYISLGFNLTLSNNYGTHLGFSDEDYKNLGVNF